MDNAKCTLDNKTYSAINFHKQVEFETKKQHLVCKECGSPAYFRKASKSGQIACFGARPHKDGCPLISLPPVHIPRKGLREVKAVHLRRGFTIDFSKNNKQKAHSQQVDGLENEESLKRRSNKYTDEKGIQKRTPTKRLGSILRRLIEDPRVFDEEPINCKEESNILGKDLFKKYNEIQDDDIKQFRGLYGKIYNAQYGKNETLWINFTSNFKDSGIAIKREEVLKNLQNKFKIEELKDKYVLSFGLIHKSISGKFILDCEDFEDIVIKEIN